MRTDNFDNFDEQDDYRDNRIAELMTMSKLAIFFSTIAIVCSGIILAHHVL